MESSPAPSATSVVAATGRGRTVSRENSSKTMVTDQISQAVLSTSNLLRIMIQSSPSQAILYFFLFEIRFYVEEMAMMHKWKTHNCLKSQLSIDICSKGQKLENLVKLPKNLLAKASTIKNTQQVLEQLPSVISLLDAHMDNGLQSVSHLETVTRLLSNIDNNKLKPFTDDQQVTMYIHASSNHFLSHHSSLLGNT
ncbi:hypothetical protein E3N88_15747 [Mikania micrantha]|uniref:Tobamovirus multiplication protein 2B n=1 Tax=Mikania micrantha TaxID=192012 RepID=A0A5N6NXL5_9ASTR|nr:hypothetical protein E3N88_15747 [Mikania micrantha]